MCYSGLTDGLLSKCIYAEHNIIIEAREPRTTTMTMNTDDENIISSRVIRIVKDQSVYYTYIYYTQH